MAFSVFGSSTGDCGVNISLVDPTVLVSSTENLLVEWGVGFTIDLPENPSLSRALWLARPFFPISLTSIAATTASATRLLRSVSAEVADRIFCFRGLVQVRERWLGSPQL